MEAEGWPHFCCRYRLPLAEIQLPASGKRVDGARRELSHKGRQGFFLPLWLRHPDHEEQAHRSGWLARPPSRSPHPAAWASHLAVLQLPLRVTCTQVTRAQRKAPL